MHELKNRLDKIVDAVITLERDRANTEAAIAELRQQPITAAREHWRPDRNGEYTILELLHSTDSDYYRKTGRRREYIGKNPDAIAAAQAARKRYVTLRQCEKKMHETEEKIRSIYRKIALVELAALGEQGELWGHTQKSGGDTGQEPVKVGFSLSPQDMSPQDVADYFASSEALRPHYDDLRKVPAFSEVKFNRGSDG